MSGILNTIKNYNYRHLNVRLIIWIFSITVLGILIIASATESTSYEKKQVLGLALGIIVMICAMMVSYRFLLRFYMFFYVVNIILLLCVIFIGSNHKGAQRWIDLKFIQIQPSEFSKILLILFFAAFFEKYADRLNTPKIIFGALGLLAMPLLLILKQPDLSTSIVISLMFCSIIFIAGLDYKIIAGVLGISVPLVIIFIYLIMQPDQKLLKGYQLKRINAFVHSEDKEYAGLNFQQDNSVMAIGSGGLFGKGLNNNTTTSVKNGKYISEPQTDFIFCIVGEELGFVGSSGVIILLLLIVIECFYIGANAPDLSGRLIACGFGFLIAVQSFVNIAVVTKLLPNTGLPLPFVSYGLSSLVSLFAASGVVLNVGLQRRDMY